MDRQTVLVYKCSDLTQQHDYSQLIRLDRLCLIGMIQQSEGV